MQQLIDADDPLVSSRRIQSISLGVKRIEVKRIGVKRMLMTHWSRVAASRALA
jgi:hypothetical protein